MWFPPRDDWIHLLFVSPVPPAKSTQPSREDARGHPPVVERSIAPAPRASRMAASMTKNGIMITSIVMFDVRPDVRHRGAEPAADPHGSPVLVRHAAPAVDRGDALDRLEERL